MTNLDNALDGAAVGGGDALPQVRGRSLLFTRLAQAGTLVGLGLLIAVFAILRPAVFFTVSNFSNILEQVAILTMIATVQTVVMVVGDFDLSVGGLASTVGVVVAQLMVHGWHPGAAIAAGLGVGLVAGAVNGLLVSYLGLSAFIATLATMTSFTGLALLLSSGTTVFGLPEGFVWLGQGRVAGVVPVPVVIALVLALVVWFVLAKTVVGREWYAIGGNAEAATLSGVNTKFLRFCAFLVSGVGAALAGIVLTARLATAHPSAGDPFMLMSIAAVFLGVTLSRAAQPLVGGTIVGVAIMGVLNNGLNLVQVNSYVQQILTGAMIVLAVSLSRLSGRRR